MNRHPQGGGGPCQPERVFQRVQVARSRVMERGDKTWAGDPVADLVGPDEPRRVAVALKIVGRRAQPPRVARAHRREEVAAAPLAVDRETLAAPMDQVQRLDACIPDDARGLQAELRLDHVRLAGQTGQGLAAVAAARTAADIARFQQRHCEAPVRQLDRGRQPRQAAAHDRDIARPAPFQRRESLFAWGARGVAAVTSEVIGAQERGLRLVHVRHHPRSHSPDVCEFANLSAVHDAEGATPWVLRLEDGRPVRRAVHLGLRSGGVAEVLEGLREGDALIAASAAIAAGARVRDAASAPS